MNNKIVILLATYNGSKYIHQQINSLISQTYSNWELWIRDDCSPDETSEILLSYVNLDKRIKIFDNNNDRLGACQNFSSLMCIDGNYDYVMFCDQDDVWNPEKIEKSLCAMKKLELEYGIDENLIIYGTYRMIDGDGAHLPMNVPDYSTLPSLRLLLSQNYLYGCTMMINKQLLRLAAPIPIAAENHDYWVALVALVNNGRFAYLQDPLILYRQHLNNVSGSYLDASLLNRLKRFFSNSETDSIRERLDMFNALNKRFIDNANPNLSLLREYIEKMSLGRWATLKYCIRNRIGRRGKIQTILFYFNLMRTAKIN